MRSRPELILLLAVAAAAQPPLAAPRIGCLRDEANRLRAVIGIAGNFLVGEPEQSGVLAAACSESAALVKTEDSLEWRDAAGGVARWPAPGGPALLAFSPRGSALAYFPQTSEWLRIARPGSPRPVPGPPSHTGEVLAIAGPERPRAIVLRDGRLWLVWLTEEIELPGLTPPVLLCPDGSLLSADAGGLVIRKPDGVERRVALPAPAAALEAMGTRWVRVKLAGGGHLALALLADREELYRLPEAPP